MTEPIKPERYFTVHAKDPAKAEVAKVFQSLLDEWMSRDEVRDEFCMPRVGRQPDYINGRWCIGCHNSLPDDWRGPCDVCGKVNEGLSLNGLLAEDTKTASQPLYRGK